MSASSQAPFPTANSAPMPETEKKLLETAKTIAMEGLLGSGSILPHFILQDEGGGIGIIAHAGFDSEKSKDEFAMIAQMQAIKFKAVAMTFFSEVWTFEASDPEDPKFKAFQEWRKENPSGSFSDYPGEGVVEKVLITIESFSGYTRAIIPIHRGADKDKSPYLLDSDVVPEFYTAEQMKDKQMMSGRFANLLPPREAWTDENALAFVEMLSKLVSAQVHDMMQPDAIERLKDELGVTDADEPKSGVLHN